MKNKPKVPAILLLILIGAGVYYLLHPTPVVEGPNFLNLRATPIPSEESQIRQTVNQYYDFYKQCLVQPPQAANDQPLVFCLQNNPGNSADLVENLRQKGTAAKGIDPIFCTTKNQTTQINLETIASLTDSRAEVEMVQHLGPQARQIQVKLIKQDQQQWKVDSISCPSE